MYDITIILRTIARSPIAAFIIIVGVYYLLRQLFEFKYPFLVCMATCVISGIITAGASLAIFIGWMVSTSIKDLGQAPLVWVFGIGPICFTAGALVGFVVWCKFSLKPKQK